MGKVNNLKRHHDRQNSALSLSIIERKIRDRFRVWTHS